MVIYRKPSKGRKIILIFLLLAGLTLQPAHALVPIDSCTVLNTQGEYVLNRSITNISIDHCIEIGSDNIVLDGAGYTLQGSRNESGDYQTAAVFISNSSKIINNVTVKNLLTRGWYHGIYASGTENISIENNTAIENSYGIYLNSSYLGTIKANTVKNSSSGIELLNSTDNILEGNEANDNYFGIVLFDSDSNHAIRNNASGNTNGITLFYYSDQNTLLENTASSNKYFGIWIDLSDSNNLSGNIAGANAEGIFLSDSDKNMLTGNTAQWNYEGIFLSSASDNKLEGNRATGNTILGLSLYESQNNSIFSNTAAWNGWSGIISYNSTGNEFLVNNASHNTYFGILMESSNRNTVRDNLAEDNYYFGILQYRSENTFLNNTVSNISEIIRGVHFHEETSSQTLRSVDNSSEVGYSIILQNMGIEPDSFRFNISNPDNANAFLEVMPMNLDADERIVCSDKYRNDNRVLKADVDKLSIDPGQRVLLKLCVSDTRPGGYAVDVKAYSIHDSNISESINTLTIVTDPYSREIAPYSSVINSNISNSSISYSALDESRIENSTVSKSRISNSTVMNSSVFDVVLENALIADDRMIYGNITLQGVTYSPSNFLLKNILRGYDIKSDLVGLIEANKSLELLARNSNTSFNISTVKNYFAGSLEVQRLGLPPAGVPPVRDDIGVYITIRPSENLKEGAGMRTIKVYFEPGRIDKSRIAIKYFDESRGSWETIPESGINTVENYVWANTRHFSLFALIETSVFVPVGGSSEDGGVVTRESLSNIESSETIIKNLKADIPITFRFNGVIYEIAVTGKEYESGIPIRIETIRKDRRSVKVPPPGMVYRDFNIWAGTRKIKEAIISFRVEREWLNSSDLQAREIRLFRWNGTWAQLDTNEIKRDGDYAYFEARSNCLSEFAISGSKENNPITTPADKITELAPKTITSVPLPPEKTSGYGSGIEIITVLIIFCLNKYFYK